MPRSYHPLASSVVKPVVGIEATVSHEGFLFPARPCPGYIGLGVFLSGRHISWLAYMYLLSFYVFAPHLLSRIQCCVFDLFAVSTSRKFSLPQPRVEEGLARRRITRPAFFRVENGFLFSIILQCSCVRCSSYIYTPPLPDRQKRRDMRNEEI